MKRIDLCIYGATSAGVTAALAAARRGLTVLVVEPGRHLGGMTTGGLGATDFGNKSVIGGIAREFYGRVGKHYGLPEAWAFEPSTAERVFTEMVEEANVSILFGHRIVEAVKSGTTLQQIRVEHVPTDQHNAPVDGVGSIVSIVAKVFIDCSYEGDLMGRAGVSYHIGRESSSVYDEHLTGVSVAMKGHQFLVDVDPYVREGDPTSGLLPLLQPGSLGVSGQGDDRVQAYNFRLCFTRRDSNRMAHRPPEDYDAKNYRLLGRYLRNLQDAGHEMKLHRLVMAISPMPGGKTDINNSGAISTDCIGMNWLYPKSDYGERSAIWHDHRRYTQGLVYFLATDPSVPVEMRAEMCSWGRCKDEFIDTVGWPHQLYVREARRMIGASILTQAVCEKRQAVAEVIGMAAYKMDSHNVRRIVVGNSARNEGNVEVHPTGPYGIPYGTITPRPDECSNLLVPVCLSASHIAYGSIRMEPVFMVLGESAAIAAELAIRMGTSVQGVDRSELHTRLLAAGQVLEHDGTPGGPMNEVPLQHEPHSVRDPLVLVASRPLIAAAASPRIAVETNPRPKQGANQDSNSAQDPH